MRRPSRCWLWCTRANCDTPGGTGETDLGVGTCFPILDQPIQRCRRRCNHIECFSSVDARRKFRTQAHNHIELVPEAFSNSGPTTSRTVQMARDAKTISSAERAGPYGIHKDNAHARSKLRARNGIEDSLPCTGCSGYQFSLNSRQAIAASQLSGPADGQNGSRLAGPQIVGARPKFP